MNRCICVINANQTRIFVKMSDYGESKSRDRRITMTPGDVAWIMSGLNSETLEIILGLSARESGTFS